MRNIVLALIMVFSVSFPYRLFAAELLRSFPEVKDFPEGWEQINSKTCTPKTGTKLETTMYERRKANGVIEFLLFQSKNGVVFFQMYAAGTAQKPFAMEIDILKDDKVFSLNVLLPEDGIKADKLFLEATGLTEKEYDSCFK